MAQNSGARDTGVKKLDFHVIQQEEEESPVLWISRNTACIMMDGIAIVRYFVPRYKVIITMIIKAFAN